MPRPLALYVFPVNRITIHPGVPLVRHYKVLDAGTQAITLTTAPVTVAGSVPGKCTYGYPPSWVHMSPATLHLAPGQAGRVTVTVRAPADGIPTTDVGAGFIARTAGTGNVHLADRVVTQIVVQGKGKVPACTVHPHIAAVIHHASAFPVLPVLVCLVAALAIVGGFWYSFMRHRRPPSRPGYY